MFGRTRDGTTAGRGWRGGQRGERVCVCVWCGSGCEWCVAGLPWWRFGRGRTLAGRSSARAGAGVRSTGGSGLEEAGRLSFGLTGFWLVWLLTGERVRDSTQHTAQHGLNAMQCGSSYCRMEGFAEGAILRACACAWLGQGRLRRSYWFWYLAEMMREGRGGRGGVNGLTVRWMMTTRNK